MNRILQISIDCGETTCASEPGKFCAFVGSRRFGSIPVCMLFPDPNSTYKTPGGTTNLMTLNGWLQRCPECLKATLAPEVEMRSTLYTAAYIEEGK